MLRRRRRRGGCSGAGGQWRRLGSGSSRCGGWRVDFSFGFGGLYFRRLSFGNRCSLQEVFAERRFDIGDELAENRGGWRGSRGGFALRGRGGNCGSLRLRRWGGEFA